MPEAAQMQSLQMNNVLFYTVFSQHSSFVSMLVREMIENTKQNYSRFKNTVCCLDKLLEVLDRNTICHSHIVVLFFFFLSIDYKMRHWILNTQLNHKDKVLKDKYIQKKIDFVPRGTACLSKNIQNPFLGQSVVFVPLHPHVAVSIMCTISQEDFFEPVTITQHIGGISDVFDKIKTLVVLS